MMFANVLGLLATAVCHAKKCLDCDISNCGNEVFVHITLAVVYDAWLHHVGRLVDKTNGLVKYAFLILMAALTAVER